MIEILCAVMLIVSIVSACMLKMDCRQAKIDAFARSMCSDIRYVRLKNMNSNYTASVKYEVLENGCNAYILRENGRTLRRMALPEDVELSYAVNVVKFTYNGMLNGKGDTITIRDRRTGSHKTITIVPFSGRVLVKEDIYE